MAVHILIKFGALNHMERLLYEGEVYMNTLEYFRDEEKSQERGDPNEGITKIVPIKNGLLKQKSHDDGKEKTIATITNGIVRFKNSNLDKFAVFCLYHWEIPNDKKAKIKEFIDERLLNNFGDTAVVIHDTADFLSRIEKAAQKRGLTHIRKRVDYVDMSLRQDEVGPFIKDISFSYQKELRVAVFDENSGPRPVVLNIGSLKDIACLMPAKEVVELSIEPCKTE